MTTVQDRPELCKFFIVILPRKVKGRRLLLLRRIIIVEMVVEMEKAKAQPEKGVTFYEEV